MKDFLLNEKNFDLITFYVAVNIIKYKNYFLKVILR
jgi:hypothetical protein